MSPKSGIRDQKCMICNISVPHPDSLAVINLPYRRQRHPHHHFDHRRFLVQPKPCRRLSDTCLIPHKEDRRTGMQRARLRSTRRGSEAGGGTRVRISGISSTRPSKHRQGVTRRLPMHYMPQNEQSTDKCIYCKTHGISLNSVRTEMRMTMLW